MTIKNKKYLICLVIFGLLLAFCTCFAERISGILEFIKEDRVLILAPHPDDEVIGVGDVIQRAIKSGAKAKVVLFTNGDNNELSFIVYEKRLTFRKREFLHMGEVRRKETLAALSFLGISQDNIIFLGYPDFGTMEILTKYWATVKPFKTLFTRVNKVSYPEAMSMNAPFVGESILKDLKTIILDFKPTKIFVAHPADTNRDHRSLYLFLQVSLWDLAGQIKPPQIFPYIIHIVGWPKPRGYHPDLELIPPKKLKDSEIAWQRLELTDEEIKKKHDAISFYKSQIEYNPRYLFTFARKNELFGDFPVVKLNQRKTKEISWQDSLPLEYKVSDNNLFVKITSRKKAKISIFLLGYSKKTDFAKMPKINLIVDKAGLRIKDKKLMLFIKGAQLKYENQKVIIKVPLVSLGNPDYILSSVRAHLKVLSIKETSWRILDLQ